MEKEKYKIGTVVEIVGKIAKVFNIKPTIGVIEEIDNEERSYPYKVTVLSRVSETEIIVETLPTNKDELCLTNLTLPNQLQEYRNVLLNKWV